jgi:outer membrane lipoprotein-sorting protein
VKRNIPSFIFLICLASQATAQTIVTAADFFKQMQEKYSVIKDYEASVKITTGRTEMSGVIAYRAPKLLRIDFSQPANQVICYNGDELTVYLPEYSAILTQSVDSGGAGGASLASAQGLQILGRNYSVAYESTWEPVELDTGKPENGKVIKLSLAATKPGEGYRKIVLSVNPDTKLITRMEGTTIANARFVFDFGGIKLNQGIPETRFIYDSPATANLFNNFLFKTE